jgi:hypothetical protein
MSEDLTEAALTVSPDAPARLVLNHWPAGGWLVRQTDRQVELVFPGAWLAVSAESIALPAADGAIETLATELDGGATYLRIGLGCDCIVALQGDDSRLLIDVVAAGRNAGPIFRDAGRAPRLAPLPPLRRLETAAAVRPTDGQRVEETRTRLLGELRRAANAGLVTLRPEANGVLETEIEHPPAPDDPIEPENDPTAAETAGSLPEGEVVDIESTELTAIRAAPDAPALAANAEQGGSASPHPPVDVAPPIDRDMAASPAMLIAPSDLVALPAAPACFGNEAFQLTDPLSPAELTAEIARLRSTLVGEFDRVDTPTALSLARLYLAHGLGIEALDILAVFAPDAPETGLLAALSWLAEGKPLPVQNLLSVSGCTGQHALWQALNAALSARPAGAIEHEAAAAGALEQTARGLRGQIAVRLGLAAIAGRDWNAASRLHAMAKRAIAADDRDSQEMRLLLEAQLRLERGDVETARARLAALVSARSPANAEAVLMLADFAAGPAIGAEIQSDQLRLDLGVLALSQRDTPLGERAFRREVELTGRHLGTNAAFELLAYGYAGRVIGETAYHDALAALGASVSEKPDNTPLALVYEADPQRFARTLEDPDLRLALARSYFGLGAPALGEAVLRPVDLEDAALLGDLARSHLEIGATEAADRIARKLPQGPARAAIDAGVALARGDAQGALSKLTAAGAPADQRARSAWAAGDWPASVLALEEAIVARASGAEQSSAANAGLSESGEALPGATLAARLALAARNAGSGAVPPEALSLGENNPSLKAGLQAIFAQSGSDLADRSPAAIATYLETVSAEARLFEEILNDG